MGLKTIELDQAAVDAFHRHLDACARCRNQPFNTCEVGQSLLQAAAIDGLDIVTGLRVSNPKAIKKLHLSRETDMNAKHRALEIEKQAIGLAAWCDEFVGDVHDHSRVSMYTDFAQFIAELKAAIDLPRGNHHHIADINSELQAVRLIDELKYRLNGPAAWDADNKICFALNKMLNQLIEDLDLGQDPHAFASLPSTRGDATPDPTDPATLGCLLAQVREAWGPLFTVHTIPPSWDEPWGAYVRHSGKGMDLKGLKDPNWKGWTGSTEAEALVAALDAAPSAA